MWRNDIKGKYMFMFTLKNLARKGLMLLSYFSQLRAWSFSKFVNKFYWHDKSFDVKIENSVVNILRHFTSADSPVSSLYLHLYNLDLFRCMPQVPHVDLCKEGRIMNKHCILPLLGENRELFADQWIISVGLHLVQLCYFALAMCYGRYIYFLCGLLGQHKLCVV